MNERSAKVPPEQQAIRDKNSVQREAFIESERENIDNSIPERFEKIVRLYPNRLAIKDKNRSLTYDQLNRAANRIAHAIIERGGQGSEPIALLFEHGIDIIAAILGVLKAGKFFVALDPAFPSARTNLIVEDSRARIVVTNRQNYAQARSLSELSDATLNIDEMDSCADDNPDIPINAEALASIMYTSGSTGKPKGVIDTHGNILESSRYLAETVQLVVDDRLSLLHTFTYASARTTAYMALLNGASLFPFNLHTQDVRHLAEWINSEHLTILYCPVALFREFASLSIKPIPFPSLRIVHLSGAPITRNDFELYKKRFDDSVLLEISMGTTEARGIGIAVLNKQFAFPNKGNPVGYAPPGKKILILDANHRVLPSGEVGQIAIQGKNLNPGYWRMPNLTAEKYLPDPSGGDQRIYLTGDLGLMLADGFLVHLGREDLLVKIRGYRVDIGEIESALLQHPMLRDVGVAAWDRDSEEKYLVAYIVSRPETTLNTSDLNEFLRKNLPDYMIPARFVFLDSLPMANGKLDRRALPMPDNSRPSLKLPFIAPSSDVEQKLADIWSAVLGVEPLGIDDNFFALGGHSLAASRMISQVIKTFQLELPLKALFESPTVAELATIIIKMRSEQYSKFESRPLNNGLINLAIPRREIGSPCPLSFGQERLWLLNQLEPESRVYNEPKLFRLTGPLDVSAFEKSLNHIVARHEVLRTTIALVDGKPVQRIAVHRTIELPVIDLRTCNAQERNAEARRLIDETMRRPIDLSRDLMLRFLLLQLEEQEHILLVITHHIATDAWSSGIFWQELTALYEAFTIGRSAELKEIPIQYADYAVWQREWLKGEELERQLSYWKKQLEGAPGVLNLSTDRPRPAVQSHRGARQAITLSKDLSEKLRALSRREGVTLYMTLLAAFQTLLYRYTGQEDIVIGSPIANRTQSEIEGLIGFFVNTLVLRAKFFGNPSFRELLHQVRTTALEAYEHQDLPFEKLVEELRPERNLSHSPLFQVMFNMNETGDIKVDLPGLTVERLSFSEVESKFDFTLYAREQSDEVHFNLVYRVDLFSESWATYFLQQYSHLLTQVVSAPEQRVNSYSLVTPESCLLLPDPTAVIAEPLQQVVTDTFLSWAKKTPAQVALSQGGQTWTYGQLAARADTIGRALNVTGLETGDIVAVHGRRGFGLIAAMIGTFLSGGVLLLIDYDLPNQRKQLMLKEGGARKILFIGDGREDTRVNTDFSIDILSVEPATGLIIDFDSREDLKTTSLPEVSPNDPAYIFFTSGTTGIPKAVLGCHKALSHFLKWQRETFAVGPNDRIAQLTNLSFDVVLRDIFLPLTSGATLCLPEFNDDIGSYDTIDWLQRERISVLHAVPSLAETWLASVMRPFSLPSLRWVFFAGEPLTHTLVVQWRSSFQSNAEIVNFYGPTETTLVKCYYRVPPNPRPGVQPVGLPTAGAQALVLAHDGGLCGINELGEIVLRTPFRSLGYLNAPEESQKRFVKNPFREDPEDLIYFTGDAGRYRPDGTLEILGRLDDQVKIRGVRVEPAEVTAILSQHPLVASCIVVGNKNERGETCLVAYVVALEQGLTTAAQLRSYLLDRLPAPMVPPTFVFLDSLPLTPNGKVDRSALPQPDYQRRDAKEGFVTPRSELEGIVAGIWAEVLKLERIGIHDNFFEAGGHSLLATRVVSRVMQAFQLELPLKALFDSPTVAEMARLIEQNRAKTASDERLEQMLGEVEAMSAEKAQRLLDQESGQGEKTDER